MRRTTVQIVHTPGHAWPYKIVFEHGGQRIGELPVASLDAGHAIATDLLQKFERMAEEEVGA